MKLLLVTGALILAACVVGTSLSRRDRSSDTDDHMSARALAQVEPTDRRLTVFFTGGVQGTLEPCGCNSDPLGGIERFAALVRTAGQHAPTLVLDGGNLSYPQVGVAPVKREAADLRAGFLAEQMPALGLAGSGLGAADLIRGAERVAPARFAINVSDPPSYIRPSVIHVAGDLRIGIMGVVDPVVARQHGLAATDPVDAATAEAERLRAQGADLVFLLAPLDRPAARQVARAAAVDFVVLGQNLGEGQPRAEAVGDAYLIAPGEELQRAGRLDIVVRKDIPAGRIRLVDAGGAAARTERQAQLQQQIEALSTQLAAWASDAAGADPHFVRQKQETLVAMKTEAQHLAETPWQPPAESYFTNQIIPIRRALPQDAVILAAMRALDRQIAAVNLKNAQPPPQAEAGRAHFVGDQTCANCHKQATAYWQTTVHARAWKTLVDGGKQYDLECVGCHVTGYGEVGGSALGFTTNLEAVQCETCHGPGSIHVAEEGLEDPVAVRLETPENTCLQCHNEKHSDTFDYTAYLRDILGPGHGNKRRLALGPGPTGHELRQAALAQAEKAGLAQKATP